MAEHTVNIDVIDLTVTELNPVNIAIINQPNPVTNYAANAKEVRDLIQIPQYTVYESGTSNVISGRNYFDYFPEEGGGGGGGGVTPEEVQNMINSSMSTLAPVASSGDYDDLIDKPVVDSATSTESTNAIQNKGITNFVNSSIETATATFRGTYTTIEALNAAAGDKNDYAFYNHTDATGNTVFDRYKFVPTEQADLPEGYTQLEYIESSGTQYIDTGVPPTSKRRFYIKFNPLDYVYSIAFFGLTGFSSRNYQDPFRLVTDNLNGRFDIDGVSTVVPLNFPGVNEFEYNYPSITVNGAVSSMVDPGTWHYPAGSNIFLFAYRNDSKNKAYAYSSMRLYACKIYDTDGVTLIRDFIPCKNASNAIGLYDLINDAFYPNKGSGAFIAGPQANGYWEYEYTLNNSSFTAEQWAAINSGITSSDKTQIATNTNDISSLNTNKLDKTGTAAKATADSAGNNIITTYAKKTDLNKLVCTYRGTYTTAEALNAASGDINDFAFLKTTDSDGNEIYSRYSRVEIPQVVPEGYTQLMYISSNGTQYIDTGVQAKRDLKSYIKFTRNSYSSGSYIGAREETVGRYELRFDDWSGKFYCEMGSSSVNIPSVIGSISEIVIEYPTVTVDDTVFNISAQSDFTLEKNIYLCASNGNSGKGVISLYECIIYDDDKTTELKHFYPCKNSSNVCGMYDSVEGVFYPDANGGNFTAGPQANGYWNFEYSIPGNLLSSTQFSALNSGIDSTKVAQIETNRTNILSTYGGIVGKNKIYPHDIIDTFNNDITYIINSDNTITFNGVAANNRIMYFAFTVPETGDYMLTGCPSNGGGSTYYQQIRETASVSTDMNDSGNGKLVTLSANTTYYLFILIISGVNMTGITFSQMICKKTDYDVSSAYQPYVMSNAELTRTIGDINSVLEGVL